MNAIQAKLEAIRNQYMEALVKADGSESLQP